MARLIVIRYFSSPTIRATEECRASRRLSMALQPLLLSKANSRASLQALPTQYGLATTVSGTAWAQQLSQQLGQPVTAGEPILHRVASPRLNAFFPTQRYRLRPSLPFPESCCRSFFLRLREPSIRPLEPGTYSTSSGKVNLVDNKYSGRIDANSILVCSRPTIMAISTIAWILTGLPMPRCIPVSASTAKATLTT